MTRRIAIAVALLTGCFFSLRASLEKASATQTEMAVRRPASLSGTVSGETTSAPQTHLITQNIEDIRLGQRVVARNPLREQTQSPSVIQPATWRAVRLKMTSDGIVYDLAFLRPLSWIHSSGAEPGRMVSLELHEMGLQGLAEVVSIDS